ncbi:hypothetical protein BP5796_06020 [Coleophoma crateriformis]|uniref:Exoribonuclease phosphorolytic domain-containing protein n=1 Tax=Coleophoma crateriformis TaxID=565419 RepID=A0A3D8RVZ8_9HELO|nr:hypothetical protein BP5796_06020 [Coleophoma crateriformis]
MTLSSEPTAILSHLHRADGSATFSQNGYTVIGAVNGPIEVQRRDELAEEAAIEVIIRPAAGVGGTRERHLESIIQSTLRQIVLIQNFPRTLIQLTLQITGTPENETTGSKIVQAGSNLAILPALLQTSNLTLLSASIPLSTTISSVAVALILEDSSRSIIPHPTLLEIQRADSVHVLGFTSAGGLLIAESEGCFSLEDWDDIHIGAKQLCCGTSSEEGMSDAAEAGPGDMMAFIKSTMQEKVANDLSWKV